MLIYTLMNRDRELFDFEYDDNIHLIVNIMNVYKENFAYIPLGIIENNTVDKGLINKWWFNRLVPISRNSNNIDILKSKSYALSLSDQYWVREKGSNTKWNDINFFDNDFSEDIGKALFMGKEVITSLNTPDITSNGNYAKRWKIINGDRYLIKEGSKILNQEPFNEVIATALYKRILNYDEYVEYGLYKSDSLTASYCKGFITKDTELIPAWIVNETTLIKEGENKYSHYIKCLDNLGIKNGKLATDKMIVCDFILANKDRHYNNFGVIRDVNTLYYLGVAPIYDNGCSLWYDENDKYIGEFFLTKPFNEYEDIQLSYANLDWLDIDKLNGFTDEVRDILFQNELISRERIDKIIKEIDKRIEIIKDLSRK